jgi:cytochrome c-type biogenesis protein
MLNLFWAYLAGTLTLINPCVLPLLPIIVATAFQSSRKGPLLLALGLVVSFTIVGVGVTAFGHLVGIDDAVINRTAAVLMVLFGVVLLVPRAQGVLATMTSPLASGANSRLDKLQGGASGQFFVGMLLGAVWSPCIGPTLGGAIGLAASGDGLVQATFTMVAFGFGVSTILLLLAYGSRELLSSRRERLMALMPWAKPIMGITLLVVGLAIFFHLDRKLETLLLDIMPIWLQDLSVRF